MQTKVAIESIRRDGGTQPRAELNEEVFRAYAEAMKDGATFPSVTLYYDGTDYWLADGFHRVAGAELAGRTEIEATVVPGTQRDARWASFAANKDHGLRRQPADVQRILWAIFADPEWQKGKSQRDIAAHTGIAKSRVFDMLERYRNETGHAGPSGGPKPSNAGQKKASAIASAVPDAGPAEDDGDSGAGLVLETARAGRNEAAAGKPEASAPAASASAPWAPFEAQVREAIGHLRQAYKTFAKAGEYEADTKLFKNKFARGGYSVAGTLGAMTALASASRTGCPSNCAPTRPAS
jgi:hypothetical protein